MRAHSACKRLPSISNAHQDVPSPPSCGRVWVLCRGAAAACSARLPPSLVACTSWVALPSCPGVVVCTHAVAWLPTVAGSSRAQSSARPALLLLQSVWAGLLPCFAVLLGVVLPTAYDAVHCSRSPCRHGDEDALANIIFCPGHAMHPDRPHAATSNLIPKIAVCMERTLLTARVALALASPDSKVI